MLTTLLPCGQQVGLNDINYFEKKKMAIRDFFMKQTPELLSKGYIQYVKEDIRTNKSLNVQFRYASHVVSRYKTDHRLVSIPEVPK